VDRYGVSVSQIKKHLAALDYFTGAVDELFTRELAIAIEVFQRSSNMRHVDGVVGQLTLRELALRLEERESRA
jgi:peptidoglycan hydrolase-like protein with peptidoglycan-binding domain